MTGRRGKRGGAERPPRPRSAHGGARSGRRRRTTEGASLAAEAEPRRESSAFDADPAPGDDALLVDTVPGGAGTGDDLDLAAGGEPLPGDTGYDEGLLVDTDPGGPGGQTDHAGVPDDDLPAAVRSFFSPVGPLARAIDDYEERPEQLEIALAVARTLVDRGKLLAEAGTGTGKTLAYLVPAVLSGRRIVVSTATKNLQDQVLGVDVPLLARALGRRVEARVMKGRGNYLCLWRAGQLLGQRWLAGLEEGEVLPAVTAWAERTVTGDRAELEELPDGSPLWRELSATSDQCTGRVCSFFERCFVTQMRRRAQTADVVIVNHHLYFAELSLRARMADPSVALLPPHELVIFDEAHELEEVGAQHFGVEVSEGRFRDLARDAVRAAGTDAEAAGRLRSLALELEPRARLFYDALPFAEGRRALAQRDLDDDAWSRLRALVEQLARLAAQVEPLALEEAPLLERRARQLGDDLLVAVGASDGGEPGPSADRLTYDASPEYCQLPPDEAAAIVGGEDEPVELVRYTESFGRVRAVVARPVAVAPLLRRAFEPMPAMFVSATLSLGGSFEFARRRLGIDDAGEVVVDSPFDYAAQAALYLPDDLPDPDHETFGERAAARAAELVAASGGGAFVLCTSHRMLAVMREAVAATGVPTLVQGDAPKALLLERFKGMGDAALCATLSFWQGVDVPGRALRLVVIDKLPFASPGDPVLAARLAHLRRLGQDPFSTYQLPQAALLLRQGFGRLVRRRTDRGVVALLDRRVTTRRYGAFLLASLPPCRRVEDRDEALALVRGVFAGGERQA